MRLRRKAFSALGRLLAAHPGRVAAVIVVVTVGTALGATRLELLSTPDVFVAPDVLRTARAYEKDFGGDPFLVAVPGSPDELTSPEVMRSIASVEEAVRGDRRFQSVLSPLVAVRAAAQASGPGVTPETPGFARQVLFEPDGNPRPEVAQFLPQGHLIVIPRLAGNLPTTLQTEASEVLEKAVAGSGLPAGTLVTGRPYLFSDLSDGMTSSMAVSGVLAVLLMVGVLYAVFPVRWRLLALPVVVMGTAWAFGITGVAGVPITLVTMAGLPVLIGLGTDFGIQFHNRYEEETASGRSADAALVETVSHVGPAVGMAAVASALGFLTLGLSRSPTVNDFGILLAIGAVALYVAGLVVLTLLLTRLERRTGSRRARRPMVRSWLSRGIVGIAATARRRPAAVLALAAVTAVAGFITDPHLPVNSDPEEMVPPGTPVVVDLNRARSIVGSINELPLHVQADDATDPAVVEWLASFSAQATERHPAVLQATSIATVLGISPGAPVPDRNTIAQGLAALPQDLRSSLVSDDGRAASLTLLLDDIDPEAIADLRDLILAEADPPPGVRVSLGGSDLVRLVASVEGLTERRELITFASIGAILVGLLAFYRTPRRGVVPVLPIVIVTGWSSGFLWLTGIGLNPFTAVLGALVIGIGTEFSVLLLERYWEQLDRGDPPRVAMEHAVERVGPALTASALTVAAGFGALIASEFPMLRDFGLVTVVDVLLALFATLVVVPPVAVWLDERTFDASAGSATMLAEAATPGIAGDTGSRR